MTVHDTDITARGSARKVVYAIGIFSAEAKSQALKDIRKEISSRPKEKQIRPYRQRRYQSSMFQTVWLNEERQKIKDAEGSKYIIR